MPSRWRTGICPGRPICIWRGRTSTAAGSIPRCSKSVGTRGRAPFKAVLTHGFVLDEQGRKMSKSLGNVIAPQEVWDKYGSDILRLWVMMSDTADDLRIGPEILKQQAELYRRLRNTLRWLLGSLDGFTPAEHLPEAEMPELERWVLHRLAELDARVRDGVDTHDWTGVYPAIHAFCATDLSAFYFDIRKDAIYCDRPDSLRRRAARTVLDHLHRCLTTWLAPVLVFTAEEAWVARFGEEASVHLQDFPDMPARWRDEALAQRWAEIRDIRRVITGGAGAGARRGHDRRLAAGRAGAALAGGQGGAARARRNGRKSPSCPTSRSRPRRRRTARSRLPDVAGVAVAFAPAAGEKCARCWRVLPEVGERPQPPGALPPLRRCGRVRPGVPGVSATQPPRRPRPPPAGAACWPPTRPARPGSRTACTCPNSAASGCCRC